MELGSPEAIESMVQANLGVSIVPNFAVKPEQEILLKRISLGATAPKRVLGFIHLDGQLKSKALDEIFRALKGATGS